LGRPAEPLEPRARKPAADVVLPRAGVAHGAEIRCGDNFFNRKEVRSTPGGSHARSAWIQPVTLGSWKHAKSSYVLCGPCGPDPLCPALRQPQCSERSA